MCVNIVRVENASLLELFEIAVEIFGNTVFPEGSIFLYGTASYLGRVGTSLYASDWCQVVALSLEHWRGIRVCPLIPLILAECTGNIVREISEIALWFKTVYDTNPQGLHDAWMGLVTAMEAHSTGATTLDVLESYKTPVPSSLSSSTLDKIMTFCANNSRPVVFNGLPQDRCDELLGNLLSCIYENFRACGRPESYLARADVGNCVSENDVVKKVLVIGASNMKCVAQSLEDNGVSTEQITIPGWMCSPENVNKMREAMETKSPDAGAFVFDLLSNSTLRFEQFDGTTSLPFKSNGKFHYGGKILVVPNDLFKKLVVAILPILKAKGDKPCVILPPLHRSLFTRCCNDTVTVIVQTSKIQDSLKNC